MPNETCIGLGADCTIFQGQLSNLIVVVLCKLACSQFPEMRDLGDMKGSDFSWNEWSGRSEGSSQLSAKQTGFYFHRWYNL